MSRSAFSIKMTACVLGAVSLFTVAGVSATWYYSQGTVAPVSEKMTVQVFPWTGSEVLPDDVAGEDHRALIEAIVNGSYGLNTENSYLNKQIASRENRNRDTFGSVDIYDDSDLSNIFNLNTSGLEFLLYFPEDTPNVRYLYTTDVAPGSSGLIWGDPNIPIGERVYEVYRTKLELVNGVWEATETVLGSAESAYYENDYAGSWIAKCPSFEPESWTEGALGTGMADAIYSFVGQKISAYPENESTAVYYKVIPEESGTRTVTLDESSAGCTVRIYNADMNRIVGNEETGATTLTWTGTASATYYIVVSGSTSILFTIS